MKEERLAEKRKRKKLHQGAEKLTAPLVRHPADAPTKWYQYQFDEKVDSTSVEKPSKALIDSSIHLLARDVDLFNQARRKTRPSEANWFRTVTAGGTHADKSAALTLQLQESPVHGLDHLDLLLTAVHKKSTREAVQALALLKDMFLQDLLPPNRKLIPFNARPLSQLDSLSAGNQQVKERRLILWRFEDSLKNKYAEFVRAIERLSNENIEAISTQAARIALDLLSACPEQEQFLLPLLVNKLGHPNYKVASKVCNFLSVLAQRQPNMRPVIVKEVERLIYRPNISQRAQFYGVCFLSQLMLRAGESQLAVSLLNIYFSLFRILVKKGEMDNRIMSVMLAGTNRAFPYAKGNVEQLLAEIDTLYQVVAKSNFGTSMQTLKLLYQVLDASEGVSDRYYSALYRKLMDPSLHGSGHHAQLFNLLYKTMKSDSVDRRVKAFVKRLLQLALHETPAFACAALILVSKLVQERPSILRLAKTANSVAVETEVKLAQFDDLDDEEERYKDVHDPDSDLDEKPDVKPPVNGKKATGSWVHRKNIAHRTGGSVYDSAVRNPLFAGADTTLEYELVPLASHYHPSVAVFAQNILNGVKVRYDGDPLLDFSLMRFLDRFVFRNPKTKPTKNDAADQDGRLKKAVKRKTYDPWGVKKLAVNSQEYLKKGVNEIPADERYLHRYATSAASGLGIKQNKQYDSDVESVNSEEFEQMLDRFEPGAKNDDFEIDFSSAFSSEKKGKKRGKKAPAGEESDEGSVDIDEDEENEDEEDEDEDGEDDDKDDEDEDDEPEDDDDDDDEDPEDDDEDGEDDPGVNGFEYSDSDDDAGLTNVADDALISADRFAEIMENEGEAVFDKLGKRKKKTKKPKGFKRHKK
uniref:CCAAT-binding factor domain-containing protein n=1 Tax=Plectus sambesii TaxID=2011161 RepID=A0A914UHC0_9BILA